MFLHAFPYLLSTLTHLHQDKGQHNTMEEKIEAQASSQQLYAAIPISLEPPQKHEPQPSSTSPTNENPAVPSGLVLPLR